MAEIIYINNRYRVIRKLGEGGVGLVYLVEDTLKDNMLFALKTIRSDIIERLKDIGKDSIRNEYEILTRLKHPNLTRVYEFGEDEDVLYIVLEHLEGKLLSDYKAGRKEKIDIIVQILRALEYIHSRNIIYRDLKPKNIIIIKDIVKLLDFGLSGSVQREDHIRGTLPYFAPETLHGKISPAMDIFSAGIVLYEMVSGVRFYDQNHKSFKTIVKLLESSDDFLEFHEKRLQNIKNEALRSIISRMTSYRISDRYSACSEVISDINEKTGCDYEYETSRTKESYVLGNSFANRISELNALKKNLLSEGSRSMLVFSGPAGIGKTRLFQEFKKYCRLNNILFFESNCFEGEIRKYKSICEIVSQLITFSNNALLKIYANHLAIILPGNSRLLPHITSEITADPKLLHDIIVQNITEYIIDFARNAKRNVLLYFNDLQWIDEGSGYILKNILHRLNLQDGSERKIQLYANINENRLDASSGIADILAREGVLKYDLYPLDTKGVNEYIENVFGTMFIDRSIRESVSSIKEKVGGNPQFLEELIKSLIEKNIIIKNKKLWQLTKPVNKICIPQNILDIMRSRLKILFSDENKRKILKILSLIRVDISIEMLKMFIGRIADVDTAAVLLELEYLEIIQAGYTGNSVYYSYSSTTLKDEIRKSIENKAEISFFIAQALESIASPEWDEEIAYHYSEAGNIKKAVYYYEKCGDSAKKSYFNDKAIRHYERALKLQRENPELNKEKELELKIKIAEILDLTGKLSKSEEIYKECIKLSSEIESYSLLAESCIGYGWLRQSRGELKEALCYYEQGMDIFNEYKDTPGIAKALNNMGNIYLVLGDYHKALECYGKSREKAEECGDKEAIARATGNIGNAYYRLGNYEKAIENYKQRLKISEEMLNKHGIAIATGNMGNVYLSLGRYSKALECYKTSRKISEEIGDKRGLGIDIGNIGNAYFRLEKHHKALKYYRIKKKISEELNDRQELANASGNMGNAYNVLGRFSKAIEHYSIYRDIAHEIGDKLGYGRATGNMGSAFHEKGNYPKAMECYRIFKKISEEIGHKGGIGIAVGNIGNLLYDQGFYKRALRCFEEKESISGSLNFRTGVAIANWNMGNIYYDMADYEKALICFDKSIRISREIKQLNRPAIESLLRKSQICLHLGNIDKAELFNYEAEKIAKDAFSTEFILRTEIQKHLITAGEDKEKALQGMLKMLDNRLSRQIKADLYYEMYLLGRKEEHRKQALSTYRYLYRKIPKYRYSKRIGILKTGGK